jgi:serine dehydrogenase proteinase
MPNWNDILSEINGEIQKGIVQVQSANDIVRRKYLEQLFQYQNPRRNIIAYYSGFLSKPQVDGVDINDEDKNGLMLAVNTLTKNLGLDLILHTPGGSIAATESIVDYLRRIFGDDIRAIVPQIAMSAGTMIACSCRSIVMGKQSNLGPVDPQYGSISAAGVIEEFDKAFEEIKLDIDKAKVWQFILGQYPPSFLGQCENAVQRAKDFVSDSLQTNMLAANPYRYIEAAYIVHELTDFTGNKGHDRHIQYDECVALGLNIEPLESDQHFQDLVLSIHHCYMHSLMNTPAYKMIENHRGRAMVKNVQTPQQAPQIIKV